MSYISFYIIIFYFPFLTQKIANIRWIIKKAREFQKNIYFCFIDYAKTFDCVNHKRTVFLEMGIPDHLTCLLRNLYAGQEATVRTGHGTTDWFQTVSYTHLTLPTSHITCRSRWSPYH